MIRWYDWVAAVLLSDLILGTAIAAVAAPVWWHAALGGALVFAMFIAWDDWCQWRRERERSR